MAYILIFLIGLCFGSFISALSYRTPRKISIARGRSFCPNCKKQINWYYNIPVLSYILLGGKCRNCKKRISLRYPAIELFTAAGFLLLYFFFSANILSLIYNLIIFCILVAIFVVDLEHQIIPDDFVIAGIIITFLFLLLKIQQPVLFAGLFSGFLAASLLLFIHLATHGRGMGLGDVKFAVFGGTFIGLKLMLVWLFMSFLTGGLTGIILILGKKAGLKDKIAFGPFLVIGLIITLLWGEKILHLLSSSYW